MRVLVVDDEAQLADLIARALRRDGWSVDIVHTGTDATWAATETDYDAIVLDVGLDDVDGFEVCRQLRQRERWMPILFLTAYTDVADRVEGLDAGGDDYLTKPFAIDELQARLRALSRRTLGDRPVEYSHGDLVVRPATHEVERNGTPIDLSVKEFALLEILIRSRGEMVSRTTLLDHAWDGDYDGGSNVVDVYIGYLRNKIDRSFERATIETVRGAGRVRFSGRPTGPHRLRHR